MKLRVSLVPQPTPRLSGPVAQYPSPSESNRVAARLWCVPRIGMRRASNRRFVGYVCPVACLSGSLGVGVGKSSNRVAHVVLVELLALLGQHGAIDQREDCGALSSSPATGARTQTFGHNSRSSADGRVSNRGVSPFRIAGALGRRNCLDASPNTLSAVGWATVSPWPSSTICKRPMSTSTRRCRIRCTQRTAGLLTVHARNQQTPFSSGKTRSAKQCTAIQLPDKDSNLGLSG